MRDLLCCTLFLCVLCLGTQVVSVHFEVSSMDDFWTMYSVAQSGMSSLDVHLRCDLNFSNQVRSFGYPIGQNSTSSFVAYNGVFDGHGHTISGLTVVSKSKLHSYAGFFGLLGNATVQNLR